MTEHESKKRRVIDWETINAKYRTGAISNTVLAKIHGVSRQAIINRAKSHDWQRDLTERLADKVERSLTQPLVNEDPDNYENVVVDDIAATQVLVIREHRRDIRMLREMTEVLAKHLITTISNEQHVSEGEENKPVVELDIEKAAKTLNQLTVSLQRLIDKERQAFGLNNLQNTAAPKGDIKTVMELVFGMPEGLPAQA